MRRGRREDGKMKRAERETNTEGKIRGGNERRDRKKGRLRKDLATFARLKPPVLPFCRRGWK